MFQINGKAGCKSTIWYNEPLTPNPKGYEDHRQTNCVNWHLEAVTYQENVRRGTINGTENACKTHNQPTTTPDNSQNPGKQNEGRCRPCTLWGNVRSYKT